MLHNESNALRAPSGDEVLDRLFELALTLAEITEQGLAERGLSRARAHMITELYHRHAVTQRELAEALRVTPRNVTGLVDALEATGFVSREPHPTDRRATLVSLTKHGNAIAAALSADHHSFATQLLGDIPASDLTGFLTTLDRVLVHLRAVASPKSRQETAVMPAAPR
jgi:DNA-binding MarR family transcriptional regulator